MAVIVKNDRIQIQRFELGPFAANTYILICPKTGGSVIVDAPGNADKVIRRLAGTRPKYILMTHNHMDHVGALTELKSRLNVALAAHSADAKELPVKPERLLKDGDLLSVGELRIKVLHTPGHTPGSLCFLTGNYLISGDSLFPGGPGKTWSPAAFKQLVDALKAKIFVLPDETVVYPGHGEATSIKKEKREFEMFSSRTHDAHLCGDVVWLNG